MRESLYMLNIETQAGGTYSGHSLRSGAATRSHSYGCELNLIATLMGMKDIYTSTGSASYVDAGTQADEYARELNNRYLPSGQ
eukprot:contig_20101_g4944